MSDTLAPGDASTHAQDRPLAAGSGADPLSPLDDAATPHLSTIEALIVSSGRPVPPRRIAQALGLLPPDEPDESPSPSTRAEVSSAADPSSVEAKPATGKRRRRSPADQPDPEAVIRRAVDLLNADFQRTGRAFRIESVAGGFRLMTLPAFGDAIAALQGAASQSRLSKSALETLAIIAYRQPVTRAHLEAIRGVACGEVLKTLLDRRLITIAGRAEELGRPLLYATTRQFLAAFGLASIKDLPSADELGLKQAG